MNKEEVLTPFQEWIIEKGIKREETSKYLRSTIYRYIYISLKNRQRGEKNMEGQGEVTNELQTPTGYRMLTNK
jgi:hypothetical protein